MWVIAPQFVSLRAHAATLYVRALRGYDCHLDCIVSLATLSLTNLSTFIMDLIRTVSKAVKDDDEEEEPRPGVSGSPAPAAAENVTAATLSSSAVAIPCESAMDDLEDNDDDDEDEYEYEDDDDAPFVSGFLIDNPSLAASRSLEEEEVAAAPTKIEEEEPKKWREPTREAVNMSLRAEKETSGGKRRLAQDLYRIMNQDTQEAGFCIEPSSEDTMDRWKIRLFQFDNDSNLAKDMMVLGLDSVELEMSFPDQYPFEPPFVRVVRPRFKKQTGFVMNGALCMELLTKDGWNPINDIESVIVSIRSLLVVGDGRLDAAVNLSEKRYQALLTAAQVKLNPEKQSDRHDDDDDDDDEDPHSKRLRKNSAGDKASVEQEDHAPQPVNPGGYSVAEAQAAYSHLSDYHKKKGWDSSGWWARKG